MYEQRMKEAVNAFLNCNDRKRSYADFANDYNVDRSELQMRVHRAAMLRSR